MSEKLAECEATAGGHKLNVQFLGKPESPHVHVTFNGADFFNGPADVLITAVAGLHNLFTRFSEIVGVPTQRTDTEAPTGAEGSGPSSV